MIFKWLIGTICFTAIALLDGMVLPFIISSDLPAPLIVVLVIPLLVGLPFLAVWVISLIDNK